MKHSITNPSVFIILLAIVGASCGSSRQSTDNSESTVDTLIFYHPDLDLEDLRKKGRRTHINGEVHNPCSKCDKKTTTDSAQRIHKYVYALTTYDSTADTFLLPGINNGNLPNLQFTNKNYSMVVRTTMLKGLAQDHPMTIAFDLCEFEDGSQCRHPHSVLPDEVKIITNNSPDRFGIVEDPYTNGLIYGNANPYGMVSFGDTTLMFLKSTGVLVSLKDSVSYKIGRVRFPLDGKMRVLPLAYDVKKK
ncbi:MAG: hypothetical protein RIE86_23225 [Imperialibacter sp.]|uniref:hypothetical protein n=1 Tax=Imperialibacter sp. TaxID=2038411 RepID=UPI0032EF37AF